jgi:hypothetical protein
VAGPLFFDAVLPDLLVAPFAALFDEWDANSPAGTPRRWAIFSRSPEESFSGRPPEGASSVRARVVRMPSVVCVAAKDWLSPPDGSAAAPSSVRALSAVAACPVTLPAVATIRAEQVVTTATFHERRIVPFPSSIMLR